MTPSPPPPPIYPGSYVLSLSPYTGTAGSTAPDQDYFLLSGTSGTAYTVGVSPSYSVWDPVQSVLSSATASTQPAIEVVDRNGTRLATCNDSVAGSAAAGSPYPKSPGNFTDPCLSFEPGGQGTSSSLTLQRLTADQSLYLHVFDFYGRARPDFLYSLFITAQ